MNYMWTRHYQRYDFVINKGYIEGKDVLDVGCGYPLGSLAMTCSARSVVGLDEIKFEKDSLWCPCPLPYKGANKAKMCLVNQNFYEYSTPVDVCVAIEVFEHQENVDRFIEKIAQLSRYAFLTTPLSDVTKKTINPDHIAEYSEKDFKKAIEKYFIIEEFFFQTSNMEISEEGIYRGCSYDPTHTVQMAWCKRR